MSTTTSYAPIKLYCNLIIPLIFVSILHRFSPWLKNYLDKKEAKYFLDASSFTHAFFLYFICACLLLLQFFRKNPLSMFELPSEYLYPEASITEWCCCDWALAIPFVLGSCVGYWWREWVVSVRLLHSTLTSELKF